MKNITLRADERLIRAAREKAGREKTSLNALFVASRWSVHEIVFHGRLWLESKK